VRSGFPAESTESTCGEEPSDCWDRASRQKASETPQSTADPCAEKRTFACQQIFLGQKWLIAIDPNMRFPLESTAVQWAWDSQQALFSHIEDLLNKQL
jgi:hypothetical protein